MPTKIIYLTVLAGVILIAGYQIALGVPAVNLLGNYAVVGNNATTSANANFTASGTVAFVNLASSNDCLTTGTDGKLATTTCGGTGISFGTATSTAGINVATTTNTLTLSLRNTLADVSGLATTTGNLIVASSTGGWEELAVGANDTVLSASSTASNGVWWRVPPWLTTAITSLNSLTGSTQTFATSTGINISSSGSTHTFSLRQILQTLSGLATTKGNLVVGNSGGTDFTTLGVGTNGYVLTASSTATNGISWEAAAGGGGGTTYNTIDFALNPAGAATATSSPAGSNKKIGTNWTFHTLDYDGATRENAFWNLKFPAFTALNACSFTGTAMASATTTGSVSVFGISHKAVGTASAWTSSASTTASTSVTFNTALEDYVNFSLTVATSSISSANTLLVNLARRPTESDDTNTADARYVSGKLICTYR